jgi:hypothetical protein
MRRNAVLVVAVCVLAVGLRLKVLLRMPPAAGFGVENERVAAALARGEGWADAFPGTPATAHVAPLHPLLLSVLYRLCGNYETVAGRAVQEGLSITLATLIVLLLPVLARKLGMSPVAGWAAAFVAACLPANMWDEATGHQDQVLATLVLLGLVWLFAHLRASGWTNWRALGATGVLLGVIALLCPNLLLVPALLLGIEWACAKEARGRIVRCGLVLAAFAALFIAPWMVRNSRVLGGFVPLRSNFGLELAVGNRPGADGHTYLLGFGEMHPFGSAVERERLMQMGELAYMKDKQRQALAWITAHPAQFARLTLRRAGLFWFSADERWYQLTPKLQLSIRIYGLLGILSLLELLRLLATRHAAGRQLFGTMLGVGLPYFLTHVDTRYRLPIVGLSALLSCNLLAALILRSREKPRITRITRMDIKETAERSLRAA